MSALRIGFFGSGKMATALAKGWIQAGLTTAERTIASDPASAARDAFAAETRAKTVESNREVARNSDVLVLAVKPQSMTALLHEVRGDIEDRHLVLSIVAGITLAQIASGLVADRRVVRVMPNTPSLVLASASAYSAGPHATKEDVALTDRLFNSVGKAIVLPERMLDAVTGLSGSGPAYVFVAIEALSDGGVKMGLPRDVATLLAAQTVLGAAQMLLQTGQHPGVLKDQVASPGGTTIAGLHALEQGGFRAALIDAVAAATQRSMELGK
ncbi:MAG: pyrroline-5-carboxylate reductase [Gemmataceae bacterium]|nr:pyrroline-5-carboxylate reductase [Gemmataceae bacterium]